MPTDTEKLVAAATRTLLAERTCRVISLAMQVQIAKHEFALAEHAQARAICATVEGDTETADAYFKAYFDHVVKGQNAEAQGMGDQKFLDTIDRNLAKDGGRSLALRWYTKEGQEEFEGYCDSQASLRQER